jgi:hypothetical protein
MWEKIDTSILAIYREDYEAGKITQVEIQKIAAICKSVFVRYIENNNWNMKLAFQNRIKLKRLEHYQKIEKYKNDYENGLITISKISKELKVRSEIVSQYANEQSWNGEKNKQKKIDIATKNLKILTKEAREIGQIAIKKRWERLHKFTQNIKKNDIVYIGGVPFIWEGFKHNQANLNRTKLIYSKHTYSDTKILKLEKYCK